jgi:hypothetical protein
MSVIILISESDQNKIKFITGQQMLRAVSIIWLWFYTCGTYTLLFMRVKSNFTAFLGSVVWYRKLVHNMFFGWRFKICGIWGSHSGGYEDTAPCSPETINRRFTGTYLLILQGRSSSQARDRLSFILVADWLILQHWRWKWRAPPKRWLNFNGLYGVSSH